MYEEFFFNVGACFRFFFHLCRFNEFHSTTQTNHRFLLLLCVGVRTCLVGLFVLVTVVFRIVIIIITIILSYSFELTTSSSNRLPNIILIIIIIFRPLFLVLSEDSRWSHDRQAKENSAILHYHPLKNREMEWTGKTTLAQQNY